MKIAMIGAGAMGCRFGLALIESGAEVVLCDIWKEHVDAINKNGLCVVRQGREEHIKIQATTEIKSVGKPDAIIIFTKSQHTEAALKQALEIMDSNTPVATLQNGLGGLSVIEDYVGKERTIAGITNYQSDLLAPGKISLGEEKPIFYARLKALGEGCKDICDEICDLLKTAGMNCEISDDIMKEIWEKLAFNNAMNLTTALIRLRDGYVLQSQHGFELSSKIAREVCDVGLAEGIDVDYDSVLRTFEKIKESMHITSMLQDVLQMRQTEIDAICGAVVKKAFKHGITTPYLHTLYSLIKVMEANYDNQISQLGGDVL